MNSGTQNRVRPLSAMAASQAGELWSARSNRTAGANTCAATTATIPAIRAKCIHSVPVRRTSPDAGTGTGGARTVPDMTAPIPAVALVTAGCDAWHSSPGKQRGSSYRSVTNGSGAEVCMTAGSSEQGVRERTYTWADPQVYIDAAQGRSGLELFQHLLETNTPPPPISQTLGFRLVEVDKGLAVFAIEPAEHLYNPIGSVHGGVYATLLDSAAGCAVHTTLAAGVNYTSLDLSVKFLRSMTPDGGEVRAIGTVIHSGRRTALAEAKMVDSKGRLLATATSSCLILNP